MSLVLIAALLLQEGFVEETPPEPEFRVGFDAGVAYLRLDEAVGSESGLMPGVEAGFTASLLEPDYTIGLRAFYRRWEVEFNEFNLAPADLDGDVQQLGLDLVVTYPLTGPLSLGVHMGGGGIRIEHDEDDETSAFVDGGAFLRLDVAGVFYVEAGGGAFGAFTEFGGQADDSDHVSWMGRVSAGFRIDF